MSVPAVRDQRLVGTLNLYSYREHAFDDRSEATARVLATQIAIAIVQSPEYSAATAAVEQAQQNADDAADIATATGLLMATEECTREQAEGLLHHAATQDEQTVLQIAQRIIRQAQQHHR
jgi:AmiR/NasT family two-component response regulator